MLSAARARFAAVSWRVLNAADWGAPQTRHRLILACGPAAFAWPAPMHGERELAVAKWRTGSYWLEHGIAPIGGPTAAETRALRDRTGSLFDEPRARWRTTRDALGGIGAELMDSRGTPSEARGNAPRALDLASVAVDCHAPFLVVGAGTNPHGPGRAGERTERDLTDGPAPVVAGAAGNNGLFRRDSGGSEGREAPRSLDEAAATVSGQSRVLRLVEADVPSVALGTTDASPAEGQTPSNHCRNPHEQQRRRLTPAECAMLQAWPEVIPALAYLTKTAAYRIVGNAVPPPMAEALGREVRLP